MIETGKDLPSLIRSILTGDKDNYIKVIKGIPVFDFLLTSFKKGVLKLFLVDTMLGEKFLNEKINKFYNDLVISRKFKQFIGLFTQ